MGGGHGRGAALGGEFQTASAGTVVERPAAGIDVGKMGADANNDVAATRSLVGLPGPRAPDAASN